MLAISLALLRKAMRMSFQKAKSKDVSSSRARNVQDWMTECGSNEREPDNYLPEYFRTVVPKARRTDFILLPALLVVFVI